MGRLILILLCTVLVMVVFFYFHSPSVDLPLDVKQAYDALPKSLDYNVDVKPILSDKCFACHGPDKAKQKAGLRLDMAQFAYADLPEDKGKVAINPEGEEFFSGLVSGHTALPFN